MITLIRHQLIIIEILHWNDARLVVGCLIKKLKREHIFLYSSTIYKGIYKVKIISVKFQIELLINPNYKLNRP